MRESIGTAFMLNFIVLFIFLVFAFLAGTFSYYKAYRINSYIVNAIEVYEGYNQYAKEYIEQGLSSLGYDVTTKVDCPSVWDNSVQNYMLGENAELDDFTIQGRRVLANPDDPTDEGYCVYLYVNDNGSMAYSVDKIETTDIYYHYGVLTFMRFRFPVVEDILRIPIFSRTNRMYCYGNNCSF